MEGFSLNERLEKDTVKVADLGLCRVLLMNDKRFPWLILVPRRAGITELHELSKADRAALVEETAAASRALSVAFAPDKMNIGAIGNLVAQLHVHVVARKRTDPAWPGPVWGSGPAVPYPPAAIESVASALREALEAGLKRA